MADPGDDVLEEEARALRVELAEAQGVEDAIGRAPSAKTSRRIPPTPVAAPWKGSTALGWLCDSTLNATE